MTRRSGAQHGKRPDRHARPTAFVAGAEPGPPFDAGFFLSQLAGFVRNRCPSPEAGLPKVELHLMAGEVLDLCHVIGVSPGWVALAVAEPSGLTLPPRVRTELVPYAAIVRVTVRTAPSETTTIGFETRHPPVTLDLATVPPMTPEAALLAARGGPAPRIARKRRG